MNNYMIIGAIFFFQSLFAIAQAQSQYRLGLSHKFIKHFDSYLQTQLKQALPYGLSRKVDSSDVLDSLIFSREIVICHSLCKIDLRKGGYTSFDGEASQLVSKLEGIEWRNPSEDNFDTLKKRLDNHLQELFPDQSIAGILKYRKIDGSVVMIRDNVWYQYLFSFDGYADEPITITDTIVKDPANTFQLRTDTQPARGFGANLVLRLGKPQHQYLVASGYHWRTLAEKFGESVVMDWYNGTASPTIDQLNWVVHFLYDYDSETPKHIYILSELLRHWRSSAGLGEPLTVSDYDKQLAKDLAEHRDMILAGEYEITSSRDLIAEVLDERDYSSGLNKVSMTDLRPQSPSELGWRRLSHLTYDLITRHLNGELIVDQQTMKNFLEVLRARDLKFYHLEKRIHKAIVFEELLHRYQLAKKANHDLSNIDSQLREVLDLYRY